MRVKEGNDPVTYMVTFVTDSSTKKRNDLLFHGS